MKQPLKVLSTSLGLMLVSHMLLLPAGSAESPAPTQASGAVPKLVEWSSEEVKAYFDPNVDWSLPITAADDKASPTPSPAPGAVSNSSGGSAAPIIVNNGGGFGWDDMLLYHLIFNSGRPYSSSGWVNSHPSYDYKSKQPYVTKTYSGNTFTNRSAIKTPTTSSGTGTFTTNKSSSSTGVTSSSNSGTKSVTNSSSSSSSSSGFSSGSTSKSTSASSGSIGGRSSGFSSSSGG